ncbi:MAG: DUF3837 domain-containing protein [Lachnospiraceae bacterium]|nr:DUF3837 domain-containing protein [Lachnospiraceae bacterium]
MVTSLARQAIIIKSKDNTSGVLGNYECSYCLGLFSKVAGIAEDDSYQDMVTWHQAVMTQMEQFETEDPQLAEVLRMMRAYEPAEEVDEQMRELYHVGLAENRMWQL